MIEVSQCVICDGPLRMIKRALVAPFLAERIWKRKPFCVNLVGCQSCGFIFYNPRLDDSDLQNLYTGYRSEEYCRMRHATEPWYTPKFNADLASPDHYAGRRARLGPILRRHLGQREIRRILDYGGDRGDLVVGLTDCTELFVYDISGVEAACGVTAVKNARSCQADLIINSNVLEHVGFPRALVSEIFSAAPENGLVLLEVPCELPTGFPRIARRIAQAGIMSLYRPLLAPYLLKPAVLYMMHEHVNYFTERTLSELMSRCGGEVLASGAYPSATRGGKADMGWCLGRKRSAPSSRLSPRSA